MKRLVKNGLPLLAVTVLALAVLASCTQKVKGKVYRQDGNFGSTMEFVAGNTVLIRDSSSALVGTYRVHENIVVVTYTSGSNLITVVFRVVSDDRLFCEQTSGTGSITAAGAIWTKQ